MMLMLPGIEKSPLKEKCSFPMNNSIFLLAEKQAYSVVKSEDSLDVILCQLGWALKKSES